MEFREMKRKKQQLTQDECKQILEKNTSGVLAVLGDNGYPYAVPLSYLYIDGAIYFHGAKSGHKLDAIRKNAKASFCVIDQDQVVPETYTTHYRSIIAFGHVRIMDSEAEIRTAIDLLAKKYAPDDTEEHRNQAIEAEYSGMAMLKLEIDHLTGKQARELMPKTTQ